MNTLKAIEELSKVLSDVKHNKTHTTFSWPKKTTALYSDYLNLLNITRLDKKDTVRDYCVIPNDKITRLKQFIDIFDCLKRDKSENTDDKDVSKEEIDVKKAQDIHISNDECILLASLTGLFYATPEKESKKKKHSKESTVYVYVDPIKEKKRKTKGLVNYIYENMKIFFDNDLFDYHELSYKDYNHKNTDGNEEVIELMSKIRTCYLPILYQYVKKKYPEVRYGDVISHVSFDTDPNVGVYFMSKNSIVGLSHENDTSYGAIATEFKVISEFPLDYWDDCVDWNTFMAFDPFQLDIMNINIDMPFKRIDEYSIEIQLDEKTVLVEEDTHPYLAGVSNGHTGYKLACTKVRSNTNDKGVVYILTEYVCEMTESILVSMFYSSTHVVHTEKIHESSKYISVNDICGMYVHTVNDKDMVKLDTRRAQIYSMMSQVLTRDVLLNDLLNIISKYTI